MLMSVLVHLFLVFFVFILFVVRSFMHNYPAVKSVRFISFKNLNCRKFIMLWYKIFFVLLFMMMFIMARAQNFSLSLSCASNQNNKLLFNFAKERILVHKNLTVAGTCSLSFEVSFFFVGLVSMRVELIDMVLLSLNSHYDHHQFR